MTGFSQQTGRSPRAGSVPESALSPIILRRAEDADAAVLARTIRMAFEEYRDRLSPPAPPWRSRPNACSR